MVVNETLMQFQADILGVAVVRPKVAETTALGAAYAAGLAVGYWSDDRTTSATTGREDKRWDAGDGRTPSASGSYRNWKKAVTKTFDWVDDDVE